MESEEKQFFELPGCEQAINDVSFVQNMTSCRFAISNHHRKRHTFKCIFRLNALYCFVS